MQEQDRKRNSMEANKEVREIYGQDKRVTNNNPERPRGEGMWGRLQCVLNLGAEGTEMDKWLQFPEFQNV